MRRMIKRLLKKYKYPPEEAENALETVIHQCEQWTDNDSDNYNSLLNETRKYDFITKHILQWRQMKELNIIPQRTTIKIPYYEYRHK